MEHEVDINGELAGLVLRGRLMAFFLAMLVVISVLVIVKSVIMMIIARLFMI